MTLLRFKPSVLRGPQKHSSTWSHPLQLAIGLGTFLEGYLRAETRGTCWRPASSQTWPVSPRGSAAPAWCLIWREFLNMHGGTAKSPNAQCHLVPDLGLRVLLLKSQVLCLTLLNALWASKFCTSPRLQKQLQKNLPAVSTAQRRELQRFSPWPLGIHNLRHGQARTY